MHPPVPARLYIVAARDAPVAVVLRRKPSKMWHVMRWDLKTNQIEHGSWFKGTLDPHSCDLTPDGEWMVYFARGADGEQTWTGVCRPPWLKTASDIQERWGVGGGTWRSNTELLIAGARSGRVVLGADGNESHRSITFGPLSEDVADAVPLRRLGRKSRGGVAWTCRPSDGFPTLRAKRSWKRAWNFDFELVEYPEILGAEVAWAEWSSTGTLLVARAGRLEAWGKQDFAVGRASFAMDLEDVEAG